METAITILITLNSLINAHNPTPVDASIMLHNTGDKQTIKITEQHLGGEQLEIKVNSKGEYSACCSEGQGV